ncbi:F0F1 ATP synthase subunit B [Leptobacterium flavescens]|uniref:ATP synthase subunit b n=1 Tax=Leptobacterium flavescens TaxID=472055 RepID=A0A6P0ULC5_9FLAO|nr:F0F1 ATP synthase subunit B [Leptobacterium flavescens]NER13220.1 F0F1 ATP synthase subunit B [Leptobacterium flavescens]
MEKLLEEFSLGLFIWQTVLFVLLLLLLRKYAWKPILNAVNDREEGIKNALASAEEAKKEMQNITADNDRILKEARAERENLLKEARQIKDKIIADAKDEAQVQADKLIQQAKEAFETEKQAAVAELKKQVATLSVDIAEKVVREELGNKDKQLKLVEDMLGEATLN